jgi:cytochrome b
MASEPDRRLVWDLPLRLFHWGIVICVAGAWATAEAGVQWFEWHVRFGYLTLVLVSFRLAWGFVGPRHARFASFVRGPGALFRYLRGGSPTVGHSPLAALSILAVLAVLLAQAVTGLFANDDIFNNGPLYGYVDKDTSDALASLHRRGWDVLKVLVGLHLAAIAYYQLVRRIDLLRPMWSGRKPAEVVPPGEEIASSRVLLAVVLVILLGAALGAVIATAPEASMSFF